MTKAGIRGFTIGLLILFNAAIVIKAQDPAVQATPAVAAGDTGTESRGAEQHAARR